MVELVVPLRERLEGKGGHMGLDVGVVKIEYLSRPAEPMYDFLWRLAEDAGGADWGGSWQDNSFVEMTRRRMLSKARTYAREKDLPQEDTDRLVAWVRGLPWDGDTVMLHLNW